ncbi:hypothetical protein [Actinoplanes sp. RD1]|uniref:hypothetical protein n=1 Tax=Actinoplanes sp. RD1 TaxID=3064538 RepID=UPI0027413DA1|nr:hypothetical protein [Actinoplanes sp. RD1]
MRIMKLATGLAVGYVLGARAGRDKYERIVAVAQQASGRSGAEQAAGPVEAPAAVSRVEQPAPVEAGARPRPPRKRRAKAAATTVTPGVAGLGSSLGAAEADVAEQKALVVDTRDEPARSSDSLAGDTADVLEQRRSV